jgi:hypothetical protein
MGIQIIDLTNFNNFSRLAWLSLDNVNMLTILCILIDTFNAVIAH